MLKNKWMHKGEEPLLNDLMRDPMIELVMKRDNLAAKDVWKVVINAKQQMDKKEQSKMA
jgi:hypothetical protein